MTVRKKKSSLQAFQWTGDKQEQNDLIYNIILGLGGTKNISRVQVLNICAGFEAYPNGSWIVVKPNGRFKQYTDEEFRELFEEVKE